MRVLIPIRSWQLPKTRLAGVLTHAKRVEMTQGWAQRALTASQEAGLSVVVLTSDPSVMAWARSQDADAWPDPAGRPGLARVMDAALVRCAGPTLVLMPDLPAVDANSLRALTAADGLPIWVPNQHGTGTNAALLMAPPRKPTAFGAPDSLHQHTKTFGGRVLALPSLAVDVDTPTDLLQSATDAGDTSQGHASPALPG